MTVREEGNRDSVTRAAQAGRARLLLIFGDGVDAEALIVVTTTYLEMRQRSELRPARMAAAPFGLVQVEIPSPEFSRFLYTVVGAAYGWHDRQGWDDTRWRAYLQRPELETWVAYVSGTPAGYYELDRQAGDDIEIAYFGLLPSFIGKGLGGPLLTAAATRAWDRGAARVWVHTCTLDHPNALANYQSRGFRAYRTEETPASRSAGSQLS
ncbi:MAG TPA: GNAT family N-acetyltransferase [Vicinamibacterales bacterium]|nr:GNAT family N-acetyltransferase [Vicinamibacterales bacterium]